MPVVIFWLGASHVPESPKWLFSQNRIDEATATLLRLRAVDGNDETISVTTEINNMRVVDHNGDANDDNDGDATWAEVFACKRAVVIGCGLMFFQVSM